MSDPLFAKYHKRIAREGIVKSIFCAVAIGCAALVVCSLVCWLCGFHGGIFVALGALVLVSAALTPVFYYKVFRPTAKQIAARVDELGLEERLLTMTELEGDDSYIARIQRADAIHALGSVDHMLLKVVVSFSMIAVFAAACVFGLGMTTFSALYYAGVVPDLNEVVESIKPVKIFTVTYGAEGEGGAILWYSDERVEPPEEPDPEGEGETVGVATAVGAEGAPQEGGAYFTDWSSGLVPPVELVEGTITVADGEYADAVYAKAEDGYVFAGWSDGKMEPYRRDLIDSETYKSEKIELKAYFEVMDDVEDDESDDTGDGGGSGSGESGNDQPPPEGNDGDTPPDSSEENGDPNEQEGEGAEGKHDDTNSQINDGKTYYGDEFSDAYGDAMDRLGQDGNLPDDLKDAIKDYYDSIETGGSQTEEPAPEDPAP